MILDTDNVYSAAQALTASAASTDLIDHGADRNLGIGEPLIAVIQVTVALDDTNSDETYAAVVQTDDNASFSSATTVATFPTMTRADAAGTRYVAPIPPDTVFERYSRVYYTLGGTSPSGTVDAWIGPASSLQNDVAYPDNITIS